MATDWYSDVAPTDFRGSNLADGRKCLGEISIIKAVVTFSDTSHLDEDDMFLAYLPKGTIVLPQLSYVQSDGGVGATATVNVGTPTSSSALATALDVAAAGLDQFDGLPYQLTVEEWLTADFEALATPATGVLTFYVAVILP